jgi:hypothetical protein
MASTPALASSGPPREASTAPANSSAVATPCVKSRAKFASIPLRRSSLPLGNRLPANRSFSLL